MSTTADPRKDERYRMLLAAAEAMRKRKAEAESRGVKAPPPAPET